jgi:hypothetical protein
VSELMCINVLELSVNSCDETQTVCRYQVSTVWAKYFSCLKTKAASDALNIDLYIEHVYIYVYIYICLYRGQVMRSILVT